MDEQSADQQDAHLHALAAEMRVVLGQLKRRLRQEADPGEFTWSQLSVLRRLETEGPATVTRLAHAEGVRPQSMGATVATLEAAGLISGAPDPADGRQTLLSLTQACRDWIHANRAAREDWFVKSIDRKLSLQERAQLASAVNLLRRLIEP